MKSETVIPAVSPKRVLVVDDEELLRRILARRMRHSGFEDAEAGDGHQALEMFCKDPRSIDCVLLDLSRPKLSGHQVHEKLVAVRPDIPVVPMSGYNDREALDQFAGIKLPGTLQKPISAPTLVSTLQEAMARGGRGYRG